MRKIIFGFIVVLGSISLYAGLVSAATINITSPNGGGYWNKNQAQTVSWSATEVGPGQVVRILIERNTANATPIVYFDGTAGGGSVTIPSSGISGLSDGSYNLIAKLWTGVTQTSTIFSSPVNITIGSGSNPNGGSTIGWQNPPPSNPPECNDSGKVGCWPPINVSSLNQIKIGGLSIGPLLVNGGAQIMGSLKLPLGANDGYVLTSGVDGTATWKAPSSSDGGSGDNLGNHIAKENIKLKGFAILDDDLPGGLSTKLSFAPATAIINQRDRVLNSLGQEELTTNMPALLVSSAKSSGPVFSVSAPTEIFSVKADRTVCINGDCRNAWPSGSGGEASIDPNVWQSRVSGSCPVGQSIRIINQNGTVTCEVDDVGTVGGGGGTVTSVGAALGGGLAAGTGAQLTVGGAFTTSGALSLRNDCSDREILKYYTSDKTWRCAPDSTTGGSLTSDQIWSALSFSQYNFSNFSATNQPNTLGQHKICYLKSVYEQNNPIGLISCDLNAYTDSSLAIPNSNLNGLSWWSINVRGASCQVVCIK